MLTSKGNTHKREERGRGFFFDRYDTVPCQSVNWMWIKKVNLNPTSGTQLPGELLFSFLIHMYMECPNLTGQKNKTENASHWTREDALFEKFLKSVGGGGTTIDPRTEPYEDSTRGSLHRVLLQKNCIIIWNFAAHCSRAVSFLVLARPFI